MKPLFLISCPFDTYSGYGARSRDVVKAIIETNKYRVKLISQPWGNTRFDFCKDNPEWEFLYEHVLKENLTNQPEIWAQITVPNEFKPMGKFNIGFTAGIETTLVNGEWVEGMNRMDLNLVSSKHSKQSFLNSVFEKKNQQGQVLGEIRVTKPIEVLFEGANLDTYSPDNSPCMIDFNIKESFAFLFVGHWLQGELGHDRKNVGLLIKAFFETFKNKSKQPALILKTSISGPSYMDRDQIIDRISQIKKTVNSKNLPNIYLLHGDFSNQEINSLYNHSKVKAMVNFTKGEGFGRPLLEFSMTGKPIISTNWSGHIDFLNPKFTTLINGVLNPIHPTAQVKDMLIEGSKWFAPNTGEMGIHLKNMFENYKNYTDGGKRQAYYSKTNFSFEKMKELLGQLLENNVPEIAKQVQLELPKLELPKLQKIDG